MTMRSHTLALLSLSAAFSWLSACDDTPIQPHAHLSPSHLSTPIAIASRSGCMLDSDCEGAMFCFQSQCIQECTNDSECGSAEICSPHGRCVDEQAFRQRQGHSPNELALDEAELSALPSGLTGVELLHDIPSVIDVEPGQDYVSLHIETQEPIPQGHLLYRIELEGQPIDTKLHRAEGSTSFELRIPTGLAATPNANDAPRVQHAYLVTSLGGTSITLRPKPSLSGLYQGTVTMREFGSGGLPIRFGLQIEPAHATLEDATVRELLLPVDATELFSPEFPQDNNERWIRRPLEYDSQSHVWFARFSHNYRLPSAYLFGERNQIVRNMRIEIAGMEGYELFGALSDRWDGLFAERSSDGVTVMAPVRLVGRLQVHRVGRHHIDPSKVVEGFATSPAVPLPHVPLSSACTASLWSDIYQQVANNSATKNSCDGLGELYNLLDAGSSEAATCVLAAADLALSGPTVARQIQAFLDPDQDNPDGLSFEDFLELCARNDGGYCQPKPQIVCMAHLSALSYQRYNYAEAPSQAQADRDIHALLQRYQSLSRETYLGRQLAAYQRDSQTRLEWLRTSIAPLFLAAELRAYNQDILERWEREVLDTHYRVLALQYGAADLEVLARTPSDEETQAARRALLLEMSQTWQATMEAVQLAASRWNTLHQNDVKRSQATSRVQRSMLELYLSAGALAHLNRSAGNTAFNAQFGGGFSALMHTLARLALPFNDLIYFRDGEVTLSQSLDPTQSSQTLLGELEGLARQAVRDAQTVVDRVISDAHTSDLNSRVLRDRMQTQFEALRSELAAICGVPKDCRSQDVGVLPECQIPTARGRCGLSIDAQGNILEEIKTADLLASEAGAAILQIQSAMIDIGIASEEYHAVASQIRVLEETAEAFEQNLIGWDRRRRGVNNEIRRTLEDISRLKNAQLRDVGARLEQIQSHRMRAYDVQKDAVENWSTYERDGAIEGYADLRSINHSRMNAMYLNVSADLAMGLGEAAAEGIPDSITSIFTAKLAKTGFLTAGALASAALSYGAVSQEHHAAQLEAQLEFQQSMASAKVRHLRGLAELDAQLQENNIQALADELREISLQTDAEIAAREALIDGLRRNLEADLAYERDLQELRDRQRDIHLKSTELPALAAQITRSEIAMNQRRLAYDTIVQRGQLLDGRFQAMAARSQDLNHLLGSPTVIFSFTNRLAQAESRLERAKDSLFEWLIALEYYAVRPFTDQRIAILLARNPSQLEAIANDLRRLQRQCGGIVNYETVDVSVRDQLLRMNTEVELNVNGETHIVSADERFRRLLQRGNVAVSTQTRYSEDERVGPLLSDRGVWSLSFPIRLTDFANLPQTCNAKLQSVAVQLVGKDLQSELLPVVSVLYDGSSELVSCQPNIQELVQALDTGATAFGRITRFRTAGRSVSPVARVNAYGPIGTENQGLQGLPLSSTYTLLIDHARGDNRHLAWDSLEDIRLQFTYAYQDVFPAEQCQ